MADPSGVVKNAVEAGSSPGTVGVAAKSLTLTTKRLPFAQRAAGGYDQLLAVAHELGAPAC